MINAGGIINVAHEYFGDSSEDHVRTDIERIPDRLTAIFEQAKQTGKPTNIIADEVARKIVADARAGGTETNATSAAQSA